jgi:hypothetical protein
LGGWSGWFSHTQPAPPHTLQVTRDSPLRDLPSKQQRIQKPADQRHDHVWSAAEFMPEAADDPHGPPHAFQFLTVLSDQRPLSDWVPAAQQRCERPPRIWSRRRDFHGFRGTEWRR